MDRTRKAVKFQHRIATGHSTLGKSFEVESTDPLSGDKVKKTFRQHTPVPTALVVDDALILASYPATEDAEPRVTLLYSKGGNLNGADWQNAVAVEHDVPHVGHDGAEEGERFWFQEEDVVSRATEALEASRRENERLHAELAETTEGKDKALQALADEFAAKPKDEVIAALEAAAASDPTSTPASE